MSLLTAVVRSRRTAGLFAMVVLAVSAVMVAPHAAASSGKGNRAALTATVTATVTAAPRLPLLVRRSSDGHLLAYEPKATGAGLQPAVDLGGGFSAVTAILRANVSGAAGSDVYFRLNGTLFYTAERGSGTRRIGPGWDAYNLLMSPGDMGGAAVPDILARDADGALWLFQGKPDGTLLDRVQVGPAGWNTMSALAGYGDYTGDGKNDLLARSTGGTLYIYPGTGGTTAGAVLGTRISAGTGWDAYTALVSTGDNDGDGKADLFARDAAGALWLFKGTGTASAPFAARVQIGASGWNAANAFL
ncbi:FG-GAP repeat domain-containing protein [Nonomuraea composti]|nr:VCBS repeat-containing protein [Nonomuraea sp. FMUSA5-5]